MEGWTSENLSSVITVKHGYAFKGADITPDETKNILVTPGNFHIGGGFKLGKLKYFVGEEIPKGYLLETNDIVVTMTDLSKASDTLGYSAKVPFLKNFNFLHNQRIGLVQFLSTGFDTEFIYWLMRTREYHGHIVGSASGSAIMHTSPSRICEYSFKSPPLPEQKAIAGVLSALDDKIDLLHRQNKTLEALAETLFRQWFVEEAQDDWEEKQLDEIASFLNGLACQKFPPKNRVNRLPVLKIKDLKNGLSNSSDWAASDVDQKYIIENGDVIFSWSASLMVKIWDGKKCVLNQHLFKVSSEQYPKWFIYLWTKTHLQKFIAIAATKATTMGHIRRADLANAMVNVPTADELKEFDKTLVPLIDKIITNNLQLTNLTKQRDTLLPKLMSGEVRVRYEVENA